MFVRVKKVGRKRYVYLVEGAREEGRVRQRTLCYLGPLVKLVSGVPLEVKRRAGRFQVDWAMANDKIRRIPLTFEELSETRRIQYARTVRIGRPGAGTNGNFPRAEGELQSISSLAKARFKELFQRVGKQEYRMR